MKKLKKVYDSVRSFIKRNERLILYIAAAILILWVLSLKTCTKNNPYANQQSTIDSLILANQTKDVIINQKDQEVTLQKALVVSDQKIINNLANDVFTLKKKNSKNTNTIAYVATYTDTELEDYLLGFKDTLEFKEFADSVTRECNEVVDYMRTHTITVPRTVEDSSADFTFKGTISQQGFRIDSLSFPDSSYVRIVEHKGGLLKRNSLGKLKLWSKKSIEVQVVHTNKYIKVKNINSVFYVPKIKQRWLERAIIAGAASFITYKLIK